MKVFPSKLGFFTSNLKKSSIDIILSIFGLALTISVARLLTGNLGLATYGTWTLILSSMSLVTILTIDLDQLAINKKIRTADNAQRFWIYISAKLINIIFVVIIVIFSNIYIYLNGLNLLSSIFLSLSILINMISGIFLVILYNENRIMPYLMHATLVGILNNILLLLLWNIGMNSLLLFGISIFGAQFILLLYYYKICNLNLSKLLSERYSSSLDVQLKYIKSAANISIFKWLISQKYALVFLFLTFKSGNEFLGIFALVIKLPQLASATLPKLVAPYYPWLVDKFGKEEASYGKMLFNTSILFLILNALGSLLFFITIDPIINLLSSNTLSLSRLEKLCCLLLITHHVNFLFIGQLNTLYYPNLKWTLLIAFGEYFILFIALLFMNSVIWSVLVALLIGLVTSSMLQCLQLSVVHGIPGCWTVFNFNLMFVATITSIYYFTGHLV